MKSAFFTEIKNLLLGIKEIKTVSIWQNNLINDTDRLLTLPLAFIEIKPITYGTTTGKVQECNNAIFVVHILFKTINAEDLEIFDISQAVYVAMQRQNFKRISEEPIYSGGEIIDWQIVFEAPRFMDTDATPTKVTIVKPPIEITDETPN